MTSSYEIDGLNRLMKQLLDIGRDGELRQLKELIGDLGFAWGNSGAKWGGVAEVLNPELQAAITDVPVRALKR